MEFYQKNLRICPECDSQVRMNTSQSKENPGRKYYQCTKCISDNPKYRHLFLGWIDEIDNFKVYQPPLLIRAKNINNNVVMNNHESEVSFFQSSATLPLIVKKLGMAPDDFQPLIRSLSQWRLDYFKNKNKKNDQKLEGVVFQALNILNRGTITFITPNIKNLLNNFYEDDIEDILPSELRFSILDFLNKPNYQFKLSNEHKIFESNFEYEFWKKFKQDCKDIGGLNLIPQMNLNAITSNNNTFEQRFIDFYLWNSLTDDEPMIIEIDGSQHEDPNQKFVDNSRDRISFKNGIKTRRINKNLLESTTDFKKLLNLSNKNKYINELNNLKSENKNKKTSDLIRLSKFVHQIQITLLQAILNTNLNPDKDNFFVGIFVPESIKTIGKIEIDDLIKTAFKDITDLLSNLSKLYNFKIELPSFQYVQFDSDEYENTDVNIVDTFNNINFVKDYVISDISLPLQIGYIQQNPVDLNVTNPDEKICKWFLDYLFDHRDFEPGQWESIVEIFNGNDSINIMRTGAGKSLIFQFSGMLNNGISIIISPLVSLINDQRFNLKSQGFDKVISYSTKYLAKKQISKSISNGLFKFIYVTPERLQINSFRAIIESTLTKYKFFNVCIDEAHCISEWGHDFRTSYMRLAHTIRNSCKNPVITALTATASDHVLADIKRELNIYNVLKFGRMDRPEINYKILKCHSTEKPTMLEKITKELPDFFDQEFKNFYTTNQELSYCGIIYVPHIDTQYGVTKVKELWSDYTTSTPTIFSGKTPEALELNDKEWEEQKTENAENFSRNKNITMIATNSFGMGINKENVRYIVHYILPRSMESFYQESGRAGRSKLKDFNKSLSTIILSDDFHEDNSKILDPKTELRESKRLLEHKKRKNFDKDDDIGKAMYFHNKSFVGRDIDKKNMQNYFETIINLRKENEFRVDIEWMNDFMQKSLGLSIYRLTILGIIKDYTVNYSDHIFELTLSKQDGNKIIRNLRDYFFNFEAGTDLTNLNSLVLDFENDKNYKTLVYSSIDLLIDFLYENIEKQRRRSTFNIRNLFLDALNKEDQTKHIQDYLSDFFSDLDDKGEDFLRQIGLLDDLAIRKIYLYVKNININNSKNISARIDRSLEDHPNNGWLYLLRFGSEIVSSKYSMNRLNENLLNSLIFTNENDNDKCLNHVINIISINNTLSETDLSSLIVNLLKNLRLNKRLKITMLELLNNAELITDEINSSARILLLDSFLDNYKKIAIKIN